MVGFVLVEIGALLQQVGLYHSVRAVQYGLPLSSHNFYGVLEHYNPLTGIFFTPAGEMGLALHELYEVSGLVIGDAPYEEYVPTSEELHLLRKEDLRCTRHTGKCCVTSTSAGRYPPGGTWVLSICPGQAICSTA